MEAKAADKQARAEKTAARKAHKDAEIQATVLDLDPTSVGECKGKRMHAQLAAYKAAGAPGLEAIKSNSKADTIREHLRKAALLNLTSPWAIQKIPLNSTESQDLEDSNDTDSDSSDSDVGEEWEDMIV
jgi:hypothetical protein